jgi:multiple sugar transport system substrate-binding protein
MQTSHPDRFWAATLAAILAVTLITGSGSATTGSVEFLSGQASEATEAQGLRQVLNGFSPGVSFVPVGDENGVIDRLTAEAKSGKGTVDLAGALHGSFVSLQAGDVLLDISDLAAELQNAGVTKNLMDLGKLGTGRQYYIPWIQGTYVMVAGKQALPYLPAGASVNNLTYPQLRQWAKNLADKTGQPKLGLPAGNNGLIKRFLQGYLLPSYTGGLVTTFKSPQAIAALEYLRTLWQYASPQSLTYDFMSDPLRSGAVWIAWDHVARVEAALAARPDDFVVFPAPSGPRGRGYMPVVVGLAIPRTAPRRALARALIRYLLSSTAQGKILAATGFYPVVTGSLPATISLGLRLEANALARQQNAPDAIQSLLPVGLGTQSGAFDKVFTDTFTNIVVHGSDPAKVVASEASILQQIMNQAGAKCWKPDPASSGPCQVK